MVAHLTTYRSLLPVMLALGALMSALLIMLHADVLSQRTAHAQTPSRLMKKANLRRCNLGHTRTPNDNC